MASYLSVYQFFSNSHIASARHISVNEGNEKINPITLFATILATSFSSFNSHIALVGGIIIIFILTEQKTEAKSSWVTCPRSEQQESELG